MDYRVTYPLEKKKFGLPPVRKRPVWGVVFATVVVLVLLAGIAGSKTGKLLVSSIFPQFTDQTAQALEAFVSDLHGGEDFRQAAGDFCRRIILDGK